MGQTCSCGDVNSIPGCRNCPGEFKIEAQLIPDTKVFNPNSPNWVQVTVLFRAVALGAPGPYTYIWNLNNNNPSVPFLTTTTTDPEFSATISKSQLTTSAGGDATSLWLRVTARNGNGDCTCTPNIIVRITGQE